MSRRQLGGEIPIGAETTMYLPGGDVKMYWFLYLFAASIVGLLIVPAAKFVRRRRGGNGTAATRAPDSSKRAASQVLPGTG